ncbi:MAG: site-specific DNA-methyltransferase [Calditrichaeota bacterium]|nr:site-specific DNA-methyltransferase [Calditrichota bacterium]
MNFEEKMSFDSLERLQNLLKNLFRFENEDLDFGVYRILNFKRRKIERFINEILPSELRKELGYRNSAQNSQIFPKDFEEQICNRLIRFFSRYYQNGDFISKRKSDDEVSPIPYKGEEVFFYWANKDQYYIKTTEYFNKYTFHVKDVSVNFRILHAQEEKGNVKSEQKKFFIYDTDNIFDLDDEQKRLTIYFHYRSLTEQEKQKYKKGIRVSQQKINNELIENLDREIPKNSRLRVIFEQDGEKTFIEKHLNKYTKRNANDYFIHKNLKEFLRRELNFFIKNEFLNIESLENLREENASEGLLRYFDGINIFRNISLKIIDLLSQIENLEKAIWEKKKFVVQTEYVISLNRIARFAGDEFLKTVLDRVFAGEKQLREWKELFGVDFKNKRELSENLAKTTPSSAKYWNLPVDTANFEIDFKWRLLEKITADHNLDEILDGVLIHSENFQALNLLLGKYRNCVQTVYIDPPFNKETEADYLYKVGYKDTAWITLLHDRLRIARELIREQGCQLVRCDYNGNMYVRFLLNMIYGEQNFRNEISIRRFKKNVMKKEIKKLPEGLDTVFIYSKTDRFAYVNPFKLRAEKRAGFWRHMGDSSGQGSPKIFFGREIAPPVGKHWKFSQKRVEQMIGDGKLILICRHCGYKHDKSKGRWKRCPECGSDDPQPRYWVEEKETEVLDSNWADIYGYSTSWKFFTENSEMLLKRIIETTSHEGDWVMDFFLGSGTTAAVAQKLNRKWIGIEMGDHFRTVILPRMKKVLFYDKSGISKEKDVKEKYNAQNAGGFFKYQNLEQYEDSLENIECQTDEQKQPDENANLLQYIIDWNDDRGDVLLNLDLIESPFKYELRMLKAYQKQFANVDMIETFNYLSGVKINSIKLINSDQQNYYFIFGNKDSRRIMIVWRNTNDPNPERDREVIEEQAKRFNADEIYVNGGCLNKGWKSIESEFKARLFS